MNGIWSIAPIVGLSGALGLLLLGRRRRYGGVHVASPRSAPYDLRLNCIVAVTSNSELPLTAKAIRNRLRRSGMPADRQIKDIERILLLLVEDGVIGHRIDKGGKRPVYFARKQQARPTGSREGSFRRYQGW